MILLRRKDSKYHASEHRGPRRIDRESSACFNFVQQGRSRICSPRGYRELEATLLNNLETNGFALKLGSFGKFSVRHKAGILRRIPFTGKTILTKDRRKVRFISLGMLRRCERVN
jgi:hypothetical protein